MTGAAIARAARALVGVPFRLHGRDRHAGLDCVGVVEAACGGAVRLPDRPALRARRLPDLSAIAARLGLAPATGSLAEGDVVLLRHPACHHHLAIATGPGRCVHAHAGLRRVVEGPLPEGWALAGHWRA